MALERQGKDTGGAEFLQMRATLHGGGLGRVMEEGLWTIYAQTAEKRTNENLGRKLIPLYHFTENCDAANQK